MCISCRFVYGQRDGPNNEKQAKVLTDADHYLKLREPCVASLRSDRHKIGMTDRHHRNPQSVRPLVVDLLIAKGCELGQDGWGDNRVDDIAVSLLKPGI
jgi:hypothetical protein